MHLYGNLDPAEVLAPIALASNTDSNSDILDMAGYDGVMFLLPITDSVATGVVTLTGEQNTGDSDSGMAALAGATATATCAVDDDLNGKLLVLDIYRPLERYIQGVVTTATANIAVGNMIAIRYNAAKTPVTDHASISDATLVVGPAEA